MKGLGPAVGQNKFKNEIVANEITKSPGNKLLCLYIVLFDDAKILMHAAHILAVIF